MEATQVLDSAAKQFTADLEVVEFPEVLTTTALGWLAEARDLLAKRDEAFRSPAQSFLKMAEVLRMTVQASL